VEIKPLKQEDVLWYPSVVAVEASFVYSNCDENGVLKKRTSTSAGSASAKLHVESAVYDPKHNALMVSCRDESGSLLAYKMRLEAGSQETKEWRTLTCKVTALPYKANGRKQRGHLETMNGVKLHMTRLKQESIIASKAAASIREALENGLPTDDFSAVAQPWRDKLIDAGKISYWEEAFRKRIMAHIVAEALTGWLDDRISISQALDWHLLEDYPVVTLPYSLFHKYDKAEKLEFQGLFMPLCPDANRMNLQTANRISRAIGETVTPEDITHAVAGKALPFVHIGNRQAFCLATATQTTKEVT